MKYINIALIGLPGSGKGVQSKNIIQQYNFHQLSTGTIFRQNIETQTQTGKKIQQYVNNGKLVPDNITINIIKQQINKYINKQNIIFDGFPRNIAQAKTLNNTLHTHNTKLHATILINIPQNQVLNRIKSRTKTQQRTDDQNTQKILHRIKLYQKEITPITQYYQKQNNLFTIQGLDTEQAVFQKIKTIIDKL